MEDFKETAHCSPTAALFRFYVTWRSYDLRLCNPYDFPMETCTFLSEIKKKNEVSDKLVMRM